MIKDLNILVTKHNELYISLFGYLKPNYCRILIENGPCIHFWSMRYESFHRLLKANAVSTSCNKNLLVTIATKQILQMCYTNMNYKKEAVIEGSVDTNNDLYEMQFPSDCNFETSAQEFYKQIEINGTIYQLGTFLVTNMLESETEFGEIVEIVNVNNVIYFYMKMYVQVTFDYHYHAYTVNSRNLRKLFKYEDLPVIAPCLSIKLKDTHFIATRYAL